MSNQHNFDFNGIDDNVFDQTVFIRYFLLKTLNGF